MDQSLIIDFIKEIAVGLRSAKSYPPGHPVMDRVVNNTIIKLNNIFNELPEFSMYFLEQTVIFQDQKFDMSKNIAIKSFLETIRKIEINSLTFENGTTSDDVKNLFEVLSSPKLKINQFNSVSEMLESKGTTKIKINAVKFGIQTGGKVEMAVSPSKAASSKEEIIEAIKSLKELVELGISGLELQKKFNEVTDDIDTAPAESWSSYSEAVARILEQLPAEHRLELLKEVKLRPFVLNLLSKLKDETLVNLIMQKVNDKNVGDFKGILKGIGDNRFDQIVPLLKEKIPGVYEYLAQVGLLLSEKMTATVSKNDLRNSLTPYYSMLDSQNAHIREEGLKALITIASRFVNQKNFEMLEEVLPRIVLAVEQESVTLVLENVIDKLQELYSLCQKNGQEKSCNNLLEPFTKVLGRSGLALQFKKKIIVFLSETKNTKILPMLFSFLWETGIYPEVRAAIIKFGRDAVGEALLTLKEAEEMSIRTKLIDILKNIGKDSVDILLESLKGSEWYLRRNVISILGEIKNQDVVQELVPYLDDEDDRVRLELVKTFTKLGYEEGLLKALKDVSAEIKAEAIKGLRNIISDKNIPRIIPLFKEKGDDLHLELLKLIGQKKITEAAEDIVDYLKKLETRDDTMADRLKETGILSLVKLNAPKISIILEQLKLSNDKVLSRLADEALKRIG